MKFNYLKSLRLTSTLVLVVLSLIGNPNVSANDTRIKPFIKGSFKQIQLNRTDTPYILTFWSETCTFCMKELAMFGKLLRSYPNVQLVSITTDPFLDEAKINQILASKNLQNAHKWVFADHFAERLYFDIDKRWRGELPLTYFFNRQNDMLKHMGVIKEDELINWLTQQNIEPIK